MVMVRLAVVVLLYTGWTAAAPEKMKMLSTVILVNRPNDPVQWSELDFNRNPPPPAQAVYSREELQCFQERKVYYLGQCYELLSRGGCLDGHWLVLDESVQGVKAVCQRKLCDNDKAYWRPTGQCIKLKDKTICNKKLTSLQVDKLGYGACKCVGGVARAMAPNGVCYQLYTRGFCNEGYIVGIDYEADEYPAVCVWDTCNSTSHHNILLPYKGGCYPDGSPTPCPEGQTLQVDVHTMQPKCAHDLNTWHLVDPPPRCHLVDHKGDCRDKLQIKQESDNYLLDARIDKKKYKNKFGVSKG